MKALYISGERGEEELLLKCLHRDGLIDYKIINFHFSSSSFIKMISKILYSIYRAVKGDVDVVLIESPGLFASIIFIIMKHFGIPISIRIKGDVWKQYQNRNKYSGYYIKFMISANCWPLNYMTRNSSVVMPISEQLREVISEKFRGIVKMYVVNNTCELVQQRMIQSRSVLAKGLHDLNVAGGDKYVLTVTNMDFYGKVEPLVSYVKDIVPTLNKKKVKWVILGNGYFYGYFCDALASEISAGSVILVGHDVPYSYYRNALALLYISVEDGMPNVVLESIYSNLPVVMNLDCPAIEFIDGRGGVVIDIKYPNEMKSKIECICEQDDVRSQLAKQAYDYAISAYSIERTSLQLYQGLVGAITRSVKENQAKDKL